MELSRTEIVGQPLTDVMVTIKLQDSKAAARRLIKVGACLVSHVACEENVWRKEHAERPTV